MKKIAGIGLVAILLLAGAARSAAMPRPQLKRVYFNLYTDSLKPVLNYYVNVEGVYSDGSVLPLDTSTVFLTSDWGRMAGNAWVIPQVLEQEKVTFRVISKENPSLRDTITVWLQKWKDPRDAPDYYGPEDEKYGDQSRNRQR